MGILLVLFSLPAMAQKRAMTTDDGLNMVRLGSAMISPDGESVIYAKSELDWEENKRKTKYYFIPATGGEAYQYIGEEGGSDLKYSPDGKYVSLKRKAEDHTQLFLLRTSGGEAVQLTEHHNDIGRYEWSEDSQKIYFISSVPRSKEEEKKYKAGYDHLFVNEGPNGQREGQWNHLWEFNIVTNEVKQLTKGDMIIGDFDVSGDGTKIAYTARFENRRNQGNLSEIFLLSLADSSVSQLTDNKAPESRLRWSPDNELLAFSAPDDKEWELRNNKIWTIDSNSKAISLLSGEFEGNISRYFWTLNGEEILFSGLQGTDTNLYSLNIASGNVSQLTERTGTLSAIDLDSPQKRLLFTYDNFKTPEDLYVAKLTDLDNPTRLTELNPWVADSIKLADARLLSWKSSDGLEIEGIAYMPYEMEQDGSNPFLLHIHGGPAGVFRNSFSPRYHVWAGLGYVQLAPNVRGSSGYSDRFLRGNLNDIGGGDYNDLMTGVGYMIDQNYIDSNKMAVRGWSYGGILGGIVITKTNRFKAASLGAMVSDWTSEYGLGFNYDVKLWYIGGTPWSNPEGYREKSPLSKAPEVTTPTLFLHGKKDVVDTPGQSLMFFTYLKDLGNTDVRYIEFPREPHGFREPRHQRTRDIEEIKWIQKYTLGIDWKPWKRKEAKQASKKSEENVTAGH